MFEGSIKTERDRRALEPGTTDSLWVNHDLGGGDGDVVGSVGQCGA